MQRAKRRGDDIDKFDPIPDYPSDRILIDLEIKKLIEDLEPGLSIDQDALDESLTTQPDLFYQVSKSLALQISRRDAAKQYLATVEARTDANLRRKARENESRVTEKELDSQKRTSPDVDKALNKFLQLNHSVGQLTALKEAFQQRSYVLKSMIDLYVAGYFGDASTSSMQDTMKTKKADRVRSEMNELRKGYPRSHRGE